MRSCPYALAGAEFAVLDLRVIPLAGSATPYLVEL
jgi:hypothetical protein